VGGVGGKSGKLVSISLIEWIRYRYLPVSAGDAFVDSSLDLSGDSIRRRATARGLFESGR